MRGPRYWPLLVPAMVFLASLGVYPLFVMSHMSLSAVRLANLTSEWPMVGLDNFREVLSSPSVALIFTNTVIFVCIVLGLGLSGGLLAATTMKDSWWGSRWTQGTMLLVWALPPVVSGTLWKFMFAGDGVVNGFLLGLGIADKPVLFLVQGRLALISVALVVAWVAVPFSAVFLRAALLDVPAELLEAADLDGAGEWVKFRRVVFPHLVPTLLVLAILIVVYGFRSFDFIYAMTLGGPGDLSTTLPFWGYKLSLKNFEFGQGSAVGVLSLLVVAILALIYARLAAREESA